MNYKLKTKKEKVTKLNDLNIGAFFRFKNQSNKITDNLNNIYLVIKKWTNDEKMILSLDSLLSYSINNYLNEEVILLNQVNLVEFEEVI